MAPPRNRYATFQCTGPIGESSVTIPADAVAEILASEPARIQVSVGRFYGSLQNVGTTVEASVLVGHSYTGFTTVEPPKKVQASPTK